MAIATEIVYPTATPASSTTNPAQEAVSSSQGTHWDALFDLIPYRDSIGYEACSHL